MKKYIFLFTIGPVQTFIAQARKTQDLYASSKILSDLIETAIKELKKRVQNFELIFPHENIKSKPNLFTSKIEIEDGKEIKELGNELKVSVKKEFKEKAKNVLNALESNLSCTKNKEKFKQTFNKQIEDFLQIYWIALPLKDDYSKIYPEIEPYLGVIKNVRIFQQLEKTGRKCSICGQRNVLVYRFTDDENGELGLRQDGLLRKLYVKEEEVCFFEPQEESDKLKLEKGEGLCAVCFTKRFYEAKSFPSTAEISAMAWLNKIPSDKKNEYKSLFKNFDEQLYYEENLREEYLKKYDYFKDAKSLSRVKEKLKELYKTKDQNGNEIGEPSKYYALLMLDGDNMGKWLSGEFLRDERNIEDFHKKISKELGNYVDNVVNTIQRPKGELVYAGGDDVLAFVNLNYLFQIMKKLRENFPKFEELGISVKNNQKSSASAGVVIAHYKMPLQIVLQKANEMKDIAKEELKRDSFAIGFFKHSGEAKITGYRWRYKDSDGDIDTIECMRKLKEEYFTKKENNVWISKSFVYNLNNAFANVKKRNGHFSLSKNIFESELKRLIKRALQNVKSGQKEKITDQILKETKIKNIFFNSGANIDYLVHLLELCAFLSGEEESR